MRLFEKKLIRKVALLSGLILSFQLMAYASYENRNDEISYLFWPAPPAEPRVSFVRHIAGISDFNVKKSVFKRIKDLVIGKKDIYFSRPLSVNVGQEGSLYFADVGVSAVFIYEAGKRKMYQIDTIDKKIALVSPVGLAVSHNDIIFIADSYLKKVFAVDKKGRSRFILGEEEGLERPTGIYVKKEKLYVLDTQKSQVFVFNLKGKFLFKFGNKGNEDGLLNSPTHIFIDDEERIYVSDTLNFRVQVFDDKGHFQISIGSAGDSSGYFSRPKGVAVDSLGHVYVVDALFDNVQVFNLKGEFLMSFGSAGNNDGEFWLPAGIAIDEENNIYIADSYNRRISVYRYVGRN